MVVEPYSQLVLADVDTVVDIEFTRLGLIRKPDSQLIIGLCTDGIVAGTIVVDLLGKPKNIVTLQIPQATMENLTRSELLQYFQRNQPHASQSMGEYCRLVGLGMNAQAN